PSLPTLPAGAINDGIDQPTGAAAERPPMEIVIQNIADAGVLASAAPKIPTPSEVPTTSTIWRTREESKPRSINSFTIHPPIIKSVSAANIHGTLEYSTELRRFTCSAV